MTTVAKQASNIFNEVMQAHSIALRASPLDFAIGDKCILPALNRGGEAHLPPFTQVNPTKRRCGF